MSDAKPTPPKADQAKTEQPKDDVTDAPKADVTETEPEGGWIVDFDGNRVPRSEYAG